MLWCSTLVTSVRGQTAHQFIFLAPSVHFPATPETNLTLRVYTHSLKRINNCGCFCGWQKPVLCKGSGRKLYRTHYSEPSLVELGALCGGHNWLRSIAFPESKKRKALSHTALSHHEINEYFWLLITNFGMRYVISCNGENVCRNLPCYRQKKNGFSDSSPFALLNWLKRGRTEFSWTVKITIFDASQFWKTMIIHNFSLYIHITEVMA